MRKVLVTVIIPTYNQSHFLRESIQSCLSQTYGQFEIVVVDDGSTDDTAGVVRSFGDRVRYIHQQNAGTAAARNRGITEARGEAIALLDHDDLFHPDKLKLQIPLLLGDRVGLVYSGIEVFDSATGRITSTCIPREELDVHDFLAFQTAPPQTFLFWKQTFLELGGFDPMLSAAEDWDFTIRCANRFRLVGVPQLLTRVRGHGGNQGGNIPMMFRKCSAVLRKNRDIHISCDECSAAIACSRAFINNWYYEYLRDRAIDALRHKRYGRSLQYAVRAGLRKPGKIITALTRHKVSAKAAV